MTNSAKGSANFRVPVLSNAEDLINSVDTFIFDCDGVIWKGETLIDGVPETLDMLRSRVYVIGGEGILQELELCGIKGIGGPEDRDKTIQFGPGFFIEHDKDVGAVVVGFDQFINFYKIQYGTLCIRENPGCLFIATNCDAVGHFTDAQEWAGGGSMVGAIKGSTQKEPLVLGKPSTFMMDHVSKKFETDKSKICMVGDRLDTDILFGINSGCKTLLVLSGVTTLSMLQSPENDIQPDFYTEKVSNLLTQNDTDV
ncbi:phosphoglycolate phosphatase 1A, chloroplastic isoform X7 [Cryptomeria japonica]|uniref:phosphoglycolate phosphatase 1A, chloroplastic isoform X7 n=1 Tax=Cryptomeria japonica TaxID=3369 RepID=UPI0027DA47D1|nr:phosphoglycolate phosphatase 1A, chloroplastic isoform X7 [Cryptomeria japonica]